jgi:prepilin-type N-terminal cleavage/methylation domain-containing protein
MTLRDHARSGEGFTVLELMVVVAIIGILVTMATASYFISIERSRRVACIHNQRLVEGAVMQYEIRNQAEFPPDLAVLTEFVSWSGPYYATCASDHTLTFTYDTATGEVSCANHPR